MNLPKPVPQGGTIAVVSPASAVRPEEIEPTLTKLRDLGYEIRFGEHAFARTAYLAGRDEDRAADLAAAFLDPAVDGILCARGGYGCSRLLPYLELDALAATDKPFFGFSDVTILHSALNRRGLATYHAPMPNTDFSKRPPWIWRSLVAAIKGEDPLAVVESQAQTVVRGTAEGELTGGCLCLVTDLIGTPEEIDMVGKIIALEDVDEAPHRVDAMLTHLLACDHIQHAAGIVIGEMTGTDVDGKHDASIGPWPWREIVRDRLGGLGIPLVTDYPFGHGMGRATLPLGQRVRLVADTGKLELVA